MPIGPLKEKTCNDGIKAVGELEEKYTFYKQLSDKKKSVIKSYEQLIISPAADSDHLPVCVFGNNSKLKDITHEATKLNSKVAGRKKERKKGIILRH